MRNIILVLAGLAVAGTAAFVFTRHGSTPAATAASPAGAKGAPPVPDDYKLPTMTYFRKLFVLPDTVVWHFDFTKPYPLGGTTVCGRVNYQNSNRVYIGEQLFYAVFQDGRLIDGGLVGGVVDDPVGTIAESRRRFCDAL